MCLRTHCDTSVGWHLLLIDEYFVSSRVRVKESICQSAQDPVYITGI